MAEKFINARGLQCPGPIVELFKATKAAESGDVITIEVTDCGFSKDISAWCKKTGNELLGVEEIEGVIKAVIKKV